MTWTLLGDLMVITVLVWTALAVTVVVVICWRAPRASNLDRLADPTPLDEEER